MSNENPNNTPHWRNKLDELEHLPGSTFKRDAAWDKLYGRLRGNKKSKKIFWYWVAAACLLFGLMVALLNQHNGISQHDNKETAIKKAKEIDKAVLRIDETNKEKSETNINLINDKIVSTSDKPAQKIRRIVATEVTGKVQSNDVVINYPEKEPLAKPLEIIKTNSTTAVLPSKKKLNVVHINELGDPLIESPDITRIENIHSFQFKFANGEVLSNSPIASKPSGLIILNTKPTSN
jgi:hypothetical protein